MPPQPGETVIWIMVAKPTFDLVGVVLSAFGLTGILVVFALALGITLGLSLILKRRRESLRGHGGAPVFDVGVSPFQSSDPSR